MENPEIRLGEFSQSTPETPTYCKNFQVDIPWELVNHMADYMKLHPDECSDDVICKALGRFLVRADKASVEIPIELMSELLQMAKWAAIALTTWKKMLDQASLSSELPLDVMAHHATITQVWAEEYIPTPSNPS